MGNEVLETVAQKTDGESEDSYLGEQSPLYPRKEELFDERRDKEEGEGIGAHDDPSDNRVNASADDFEREHRGEDVAL